MRSARSHCDGDDSSLSFLNLLYVNQRPDSALRAHIILSYTILPSVLAWRAPAACVICPFVLASLKIVYFKVKKLLS